MISSAELRSSSTARMWSNSAMVCTVSHMEVMDGSRNSDSIPNENQSSRLVSDESQTQHGGCQSPSYHPSADSHSLIVSARSAITQSSSFGAPFSSAMASAPARSIEPKHCGRSSAAKH